MSQILNTSIAISLLKRSYEWYARIEQMLIDIYYNSQTHRLTKGFREKIKICFRYSFLGRITEERETTPLTLDNSQVVQYMIDFYKRWKNKIIRYSKISLTVGLAKDTKEELYFSPVRVISIITVTTIMINVVLSIVLQKQIGLWGWLMRVLFLFLGFGGLFCRVDWLTVKKNSVFLRKMQR